MRRRFLNSISGGNHLKHFSIEALEDGLTAQLSTKACEYRIDGGIWNSLPADTNTPSINKGQTLSFRGYLTPATSKGIGTFTISKKCNLKGNIMSMLYSDDFVGQNGLTGKNYTFYMLFSNCNTIVDVYELILPATTLSNNCYGYMFHGCTSLTTAPELPATILASNCYYYMFTGCTNLNYIKMLATDISASNCLSNWVNNVASNGTFVKHPNMTSLPTGNSGIPSGWTVEDYVETNLITFTIAETEYQAEEGMTWGEWCDSEYNIDGYCINGINKYITDSSGNFYIKIDIDNYVFCTSEMLIIADKNYSLELY